MWKPKRWKIDAHTLTHRPPELDGPIRKASLAHCLQRLLLLLLSNRFKKKIANVLDWCWCCADAAGCWWWLFCVETKPIQIEYKVNKGSAKWNVTINSSSNASIEMHYSRSVSSFATRRKENYPNSNNQRTIQMLTIFCTLIKGHTWTWQPQ